MKAFLASNIGHALTLLAALILTISNGSQGKWLMAVAWAFFGLSRLAILYSRYKNHDTK